MALLSEPLDDIVRGIAVVFDDEDLHHPASSDRGRLPRPRAPRHSSMAPIASGTPDAIGSIRPVSTARFEATVNATNELAIGASSGFSSLSSANRIFILIPRA